MRIFGVISVGIGIWGLVDSIRNISEWIRIGSQNDSVSTKYQKGTEVQQVVGSLVMIIGGIYLFLN